MLYSGQGRNPCKALPTETTNCDDGFFLDPTTQGSFNGVRVWKIDMESNSGSASPT